jgi:hypothetical protein
MVQILERNGVYIKKIRTDKPGPAIDEGQWQLVAEADFPADHAPEHE